MWIQITEDYLCIWTYSLINISQNLVFCSSKSSKLFIRSDIIITSVIPKKIKLKLILSSFAKMSTNFPAHCKVFVTLSKNSDSLFIKIAVRGETGASAYLSERAPGSCLKKLSVIKAEIITSTFPYFSRYQVPGIYFF